MSQLATRRKETCPACEGRGCSFCDHTGEVWEGRGWFKRTTGTRLHSDPLDVVPEAYQIVVSPQVGLVELAEMLEPLTDYMERLAERLLAAPHDPDWIDEGPETGATHGKYERLLLNLRERATAIEQGAVRPYAARRLTDEQIEEKVHQAARSVSRSLTHLAYVASLTTARPVLSHNRAGDPIVSRWIARDVPQLMRAAFAGAEQMAKLRVFVNEAEEVDPIEAQYRVLRAGDGDAH